LPGLGFSCELPERYFSGDHVYGECFPGTSLRTNVDVKSTTETLTALATNKGLRRRMWAAGWARACDVNDLRHIIPQYEEFWRNWAKFERDRQMCRQTAGPTHPIPTFLPDFSILYLRPFKMSIVSPQLRHATMQKSFSYSV
jgi:hypothetical protein